MAESGPQPENGVASAIHPSAWLVLPTLTLLFGQALAVLPWQIPPAAISILAIPLLLLFFSRWRVRALLCVVSLLALSLGYMRHRELLFPQFPENHLRVVMSRDQPLYLEGVLRHEPERLSQRIRWQLRVERIWHNTGAEEITGDLLIGLRSVARDWHYGDRLRVTVRPQVPRDSGNPGGFNYATYLARREIYATAFLDNDQAVELLSREAGWPRSMIEDLRRQMRQFIDRSFVADNGALIKALVVGDMGTITKETRAAFTAAGVNHVLSISGLHVAMLGLVVFVVIRYGLSFSSYLLLRFNLLKIATFFSFLAVLFYTALAGAMVPTVRSAIMIGVYELAVLLDREEEIFTSLTLAALLIALVWPGVIADISFQLSFLAVLFIVWGARRIDGWFPRAKTDDLPQEKSWWKERGRQLAIHLVVPLMATLGTGPLIAHYFGHLSLAGFFANPLIVPLVGFVVVPLGLFIGFCSVMAPEVAALLIWPAEKLASLTIWLVDLFARLPLANFGVPAPNPLEVFMLYAVLLGCLAARRKWQVAVTLAVGVTFLAMDGSYWWRERARRQELRITHLNVGQGDAAVVEMANGKVLVIDAGGTASGDFDTGEAIVAPFLRSRKIVKVDYLVVSHARVDHYGGMRTLVNEFSPSEFWSGAAKGQTRRFEELGDVIDKKQIAPMVLNRSENCRDFAPLKLCVLHPPSDSAEDAPVVLRLEHGKASFLFASDIDKRDEAVLAQTADKIRSSAVKIPRHGSATASSKEFVDAVQAKLAVLSAGARSRAEAQRDEVSERYRESGAEVLRTYDDGAIILETDGNILRYQGYKSGKKGEIVL
jgi:competence protein ComEC